MLRHPRRPIIKETVQLRIWAEAIIGFSGCGSFSDAFAVQNLLGNIQSQQLRPVRYQCTSVGNGVHCYALAASLISMVKIPERVANVGFGAPKRNRFFRLRDHSSLCRLPTRKRRDIFFSTLSYLRLEPNE